MTDFHGLPTALLENKQLQLEYLTTAGPRIVGLSFRGSPNLLADIHDISWETPHGTYFILGGHRLWIAPEIPEITNIPDKSGLQAFEFLGGVELTGEHEPGSGVRKTVRVELDATKPIVRLTHTVLNENPESITMAPWAITMFNLGGMVILPQLSGSANRHGLPNIRLIALWPYTQINDSRLILRDDFILIRAAANLRRMKIGYSNTAGWMAYWWGGLLFRISFDLLADVPYPDRDCNVEAYCDERIVELEALGPLEELAPGAASHFIETWELQEGLDSIFIPSELRKLLQHG
jgi:hypothetical protein